MRPRDAGATAGLTYYWDGKHGRRQYLDRLLDVVAADPEAANHGYYFDGVGYHLDFNPGQRPTSWQRLTRCSRHGITGKEIWINETNAPPSDDRQEPPWSAPRFSISLAEQAAFVLQQFALAFASGASRVEFYKLRNAPIIRSRSNLSACCGPTIPAAWHSPLTGWIDLSARFPVGHP